jgi:hypothetical protein
VGLGNVDNTSDATKNTAVATLTNKSLTSPTITGTLASTGDNNLGDADADTTTVQGHMRLKGTAPTIATGVALGTGGSVGVTISGCDQSGQLTITAGTTSLTTGRAATITFASAHAGNYRILLQANSAGSSANGVVMTNSGLSTTQWAITFNTAPTSGGTYNYYYDVMEWSN